MTDVTCALPDCNNPRTQRTRLCPTHYRKKRIYGDPYFIPQRPLKNDLSGQRFGALTAIRFVPKSGWECRCDCGQTKHFPSAALTQGNVTTCGNKKAHRRSTEPNYHDVHNWLASERGPASRHVCVDCGKQAHHWSYDNTAPASERTSPEGFTFSVDLDRYEPRCGRCHRRYDMAERLSRGLPVTGRRVYLQG